jgi:L-alanine-DL-glutamate epimerase-like enolase superfamily enzyme
MNRRNFLATAPFLPAGLSLPYSARTCAPPPPVSGYPELDAAAARPVLRRDLFPDPVVLESVELLRYEDNFLCRVRTTDGAEGISVSNNYQMVYLYPIQVLRINPFFEGKDARDLDALIDGVYTYKSNYKLQSLALWVPLATVEFAILDLLGKIAGVPIGELLSDTIHVPRISVYQANNNRGKSAEESLENIRETVAHTGANAVKFKVAGRMLDPESPPRRSERLIPMVREAFGDDMTIYADANGGYQTVKEAVRIGKMMEAHDYGFYEEPIAFDRYAELTEVGNRLSVPIAGGEQEPSFYNFRYLIGEDAVDVVQPDPFYYGGMIRSMRVARMAAAKNKICVPHISGSGLGFLYMAHFVSALENAGPYHEFKERTAELPYECPTASMTVTDGTLKVPTGPGAGVIIDPDYVAKHERIVR